MLDDAPALQSYINGRRIRAAVKLKSASYCSVTALVRTSKVSCQVLKRLRQSSRPEMLTVIDRIRLALLQVALAEYAADGLILNPIDWAMIETT